MTPHRRADSREAEVYRVVVSGRVGESWTDWFGADRVTAGEDETVLHLRVADQAELLGRIRRLLDLRLRLLSVVLVQPVPEDVRSRSAASRFAFEPEGGLP